MLNFAPKTIKSLFYKSLIINLLFFNSFSFAQNNLQNEIGEGMMVITYDTNFVLNLYNSPNESDLVFNIMIGLDSLNPDQGLSIKLKTDQIKWFNPETFWNAEHILHFATLENHHGWYKIIVDKKTGKSMWVLQSKNLKYFKWKDYLPNTTGIERLNPSQNLIYKSIFPFKNALNFKEQECFKIIKVKGNWAKVIYNDDMCPTVMKLNPMPKGWIKWRDEKGLLIKYFLR